MKIFFCFTGFTWSKTLWSYCKWQVGGGGAFSYQGLAKHGYCDSLILLSWKIKWFIKRKWMHLGCRAGMPKALLLSSTCEKFSTSMLSLIYYVLFKLWGNVILDCPPQPNSTNPPHSPIKFPNSPPKKTRTKRRERGGKGAAPPKDLRLALHQVSAPWMQCQEAHTHTPIVLSP